MGRMMMTEVTLNGEKVSLNNYELEYEVLKYYTFKWLDHKDKQRAVQETVDSFGLHERMVKHICL
tara:strand:+ start:3057 stop:3251 length:195 start_codon:yes stop_codon:yes gene_type:complete